MNVWNTLLANSQATFNETGIIDFPNNQNHTDEDALRVMPLIDKELVQISGPDSQKFLQGQATCNVDELSNTHWMPGAICNPKGRMITSFSLYQQTDDHLLLEMNRGLAEITLNTITKYSAFFKTELKDTTQNYGVIGLMGTTAASTIEQIFDTTFNNTPVQSNGCLIIPLEDKRIKLFIPTQALESIWQKLCARGTASSNRHWQLADVQLGIGDVSLATSGELIPQMINLQARGGISFKKGCYTGQEIVARMKYLGKLKRRMYHLQIETSELPESGQTCSTTDSRSNQGTIVCVSQAQQSIEALVVMTEKLANQDQIVIGEQASKKFSILPLPYSLG